MMDPSTEFDLRDFLPYLLNLAAEEASLGFQVHYKEKYGMLRTEWRILFHLGRYGDMTAKEICARARLHKTKVSRAVAKLEERRFIVREEIESDRRHAMLRLTKHGSDAYKDLYNAALTFDKGLVSQFTPAEELVLRRCLGRLASFSD